MFAVYGVLLLASAILFFLWAYGQFRRPAPKKWTTWESTSNAVVLTIIALLSFGVGLLIEAAITFESSPVSLAQAAMIAAIIAAGIVVGRVLWRRTALSGALRPADVSAPQAGVVLAAAANDPGPGDRPRPVRGAGRRAA